MNHTFFKSKICVVYWIMVFAIFVSSDCLEAYSSPLPLPQNVRALAYVYGYAPFVDSRLNDEGMRQKLSHPLNRSVTFDELAEFEPELFKLQEALNRLEGEWGSNILNANLYANIDVFESRKVVGGMYGVTDRLSIGFQLPWIERRIDYTFGVNIQNNAAAILARSGNIPPLQAALARLRDYKIDAGMFTNEIFISQGYENPASFSKGAWGDLEIETRYTYFLDDRLGLGLRMGVQAPTGNHKVNYRNILDQDFSEQTWALKLSHLSELTLLPKLLHWSFRVGGTLRLPKDQERAYALTSDQLLPNLNDPFQIETVEKTIGPELNLSSGYQLSLLGGWMNLMASYFYSQKAVDKISGKRGLDYQRETAGTDSISHGYELSAELSSFEPFTRNKFFMPMKFTVSYVAQVGGRNAIFAPYWRFDSVVLF